MHLLRASTVLSFKVSKAIGRGLAKRPFRLAAAQDRDPALPHKAGQAPAGQSLHL